MLPLKPPRQGEKKKSSMQRLSGTPKVGEALGGIGACGVERLWNRSEFEKLTNQNYLIPWVIVGMNGSIVTELAIDIHSLFCFYGR
eukprot:766718-Hanusia_phi.AAC.10